MRVAGLGLKDCRGVATLLVCTVGAGITAAAGRLALQVIFRLQDMDALYCYFLSHGDVLLGAHCLGFQAMGSGNSSPQLP